MVRALAQTSKRVSGDKYSSWEKSGYPILAGGKFGRTKGVEYLKERPGANG